MFREQPERGEPHPQQPQQPSQARQERRSLNLSVVFEELPLQFLNIKTTERFFFSFWWPFRQFLKFYIQMDEEFI